LNNETVTLILLTEEDYNSFCLAYMFTYRDFEGGTLGLAWTGDLKNAGGVCEKNGVILTSFSVNIIIRVQLPLEYFTTLHTKYYPTIYAEPITISRNLENHRKHIRSFPAILVAC